MSDLAELYQQVILDHNKAPRNYHAMPDATKKADGENPLCGDRVTVFLRLKDEVIEDVSFQGQGCAISKASASLMTASLKGKTLAEAEATFGEFHSMVTGEPADTQKLGKLAVFSGVRDYPSRVKCATLAWHTLHAALKEGEGKVTTE